MSGFEDVEASPLYAWREHQLNALATALQVMVNAWSGEWGVVLPVEGVSCRLAQDVQPDRWSLLGVDGGAAVWTQAAAPGCCGMGAGLFGSAAAAGVIADRVASMCWEDLLQRARKLLRVGLQATAILDRKQVERPWSGWIEARMPPGVSLLLHPRFVARLLEERPAPAKGQPVEIVTLTPVHEALASQPVGLQVELGGCEMNLGELQDLRVGDVVRLRHRLDRPARVLRHDGAALFDGYLARARGCKALELTHFRVATEELQ